MGVPWKQGTYEKKDKAWRMGCGGCRVVGCFGGDWCKGEQRTACRTMAVLTASCAFRTTWVLDRGGERERACEGLLGLPCKREGRGYYREGANLTLGC